MSKLDDTSNFEMSDIFMPREYWVPDEEAECCHSCKLTFDLLNRRHHCRMCGNVFDIKCADNFLSQPSFIYNKEKKIRVCNDCYQKTVVYMTKNDNSPAAAKGLKMSQRLSSSKFLEFEDVISQNLTKKLYELSEHVLAYILKEGDGHYDKWFPVLKGLVVECMETVQPIMIRSEQVNLNKFIKIKKVPYKNTSLTRLVKGLVVRKNVNNKKMSCSHENPSVLMIKGDVEQQLSNEACVLDANSIKRETSYLESIVQKIVKLDPSIIITEGTIARTVQDKLTKLNKTLLSRFRKSQFSKIARCINAQPVYDLENLEGLSTRVLGTCEKLKIINYQNKEYYKDAKNFRPEEFSENTDFSLLFLEGKNTNNGVTILVSGPDYQELMAIKKALHETFNVLRSLFLERGMISQEVMLLHTKERLWKILSDRENKKGAENNKDIRDELNIEAYQQEKVNEIGPVTCLLNQITVGSAGYMLSFLTERLPIEKLMKKTSFKFTKLLIVPSMGKGLVDLNNSDLNPNEIIQVALGRSKAWYTKDLCELHKEPKQLKVYYGSKDDVTLHIFLTGLADRAFEKCIPCTRRYSKHLTYFLTEQYYIQISVDTKTGSRPKRKKSSIVGKLSPKRDESQLKKFSESSFFDLLASPTLLKDSRSVTSLSTMSLSPKPKRKKVESMMSDVFMYLECSCCKTRLSDVVKLKKTFLTYSFARYLESLLSSAEKYFEYLLNEENYLKRAEGDSPKDFLHSLRNLPLKNNLKLCCLYNPKNRIFVVDSILIKFQIGALKPYSVEPNGFMHQKAEIESQKAEEKLVKQKQANFIELTKNYTTLIQANVKEILLYLIQKSNLDLSLETLFSAPALLNEANPLAKDPSNVLLLSLIPIYEQIGEMKKESAYSFIRVPANHLEIDVWRKTFYENIERVFDSIDKAKNVYLQSVKDLNAAKSQEINLKTRKGSTSPKTFGEENMLDKTGFELNDFSISKKPICCFSEDEATFTFETKEPIKLLNLEVSEVKPKGCNIEKEAVYAQEASGGRSFYQEDLDYEQFMKYKTIPVFETKPLSMLAYCLNSPKYMNEVYLSEELINYEKFTKGSNVNRNAPEYIKFVRSKLIAEDSNTIKQFQIRAPSVEIQFKYFNDLVTGITGKKTQNSSPITPLRVLETEIIEDFISCFEAESSRRRPTRNGVSKNFVTHKFTTVLHYPVQFEVLRGLNGISLSDFLLSISYCQDWQENNGGKTGATFVKSHDEKFVCKQLEKKEFMMLMGFADEYFKYMWKVCGEGQESLLAIIYGMFEIHTEKKGVRYYIIMENIMYGMEGKLKLYDLKGSELNRYVKDSVLKSKTLLDTNYMLDRNSQPLPVKSKHFDFVDEAIRNDSEFLCGLKVVDYSLLLVIQEDKGLVKMGIIDYLRLYDFEKHLEHMSKKIIKGATPTIIRPDEYKERFQRAMRKYFMPVHYEENNKASISS